MQHPLNIVQCAPHDHINPTSASHRSDLQFPCKMNRTYIRTSSLARKFFDDFPDQHSMPLLLTPQQQAAFQQYVMPLLQLTDTTTDGCCEAVMSLLPVFSSSTGFATYSAARSAADYVQSPLALCILDTAAAFSLLPGSTALAAADPPALRELITEDLRRRVVANSLSDVVAGTVEVVLDRHPAVAAAQPCPGDADRLLLPDSAALRYCSLQQQQQQEVEVVPATNGSSLDKYYAPFQSLTASARQQHSSGAALHAILRRAVWRRRLTRECSHYLAPILGKDASGSVVLVGSSLASIVKGYSNPTADGAAHQHSSSSSSSYNVAFVGYADSTAAHTALEGCVTEVLTRYFARHPAAVTDAAGQPVTPLAVAATHHLLLLLPEPTSTQLPTAVGLDQDALAAAAAAGAWAGPAAAAAADPAALADPAAVAAAAAGAPAPAASASAAGAGASAASSAVYRDIVLCFDLALHPNVEALLLAAPNQLAAFTYDGDDLHTLPSAVRALASGALLLDPAAVARGSSWCGDAAPVGEGEGAASFAPAAAPGVAATAEETATSETCGATQLLRSAVLGADRVTAAVQQVKAAAAAGWQPLLLLPLLLPAAATRGNSSNSATPPLLPAEGDLLLPLLRSDLVTSLAAKAVGGGSSSSSSSSDALKAAEVHWWDEMATKFGVWGLTAEQQQHIKEQLDLSSASAGAAAGAVDPVSRLTADGDKGARQGGEVSPAVLLQQPQLLRALLTHAAAAAAAPAATPPPTRPTQAAPEAPAAPLRQLQQLRHVHGWMWSILGVQEQQGQQEQGAAAAVAALGCKRLPDHLSEVVRSRWWAGPIMRGSLLEGAVAQE